MRILASLVLRLVILAWLPLPLAWWLCAIIDGEAREVGNGGGGDKMGDWEARAEGNATIARRWETYEGDVDYAALLLGRPALSAA
jgi:hypothetical protein